VNHGRLIDDEQQDNFVYRHRGGKLYKMCASKREETAKRAMNTEQEEHVGATEETTNTASNSSIEAEAVVDAPVDAAEIASGDATTITAPTATTAMMATVAADAEPLASDNTRIRNSLEAIKTAIVWLVVVNILTVLSPLLRASLKWTLAIGVLLIVGSLVIGCVGYMKARHAQKRIPE
jgi:hypothetical protein